MTFYICILFQQNNQAIDYDAHQEGSLFPKNSERDLNLRFMQTGLRDTGAESIKEGKLTCTVLDFITNSNVDVH